MIPGHAKRSDRIWRPDLAEMALQSIAWELLAEPSNDCRDIKSCLSLCVLAKDGQRLRGMVPTVRDMRTIQGRYYATSYEEHIRK